MIVHLDFETFSRCDIKSAGTFAYARHPSTEVLCVRWAVDNGPIELWHPWLGCPLPAELVGLCQAPDVTFCAHNATFEIEIMNGHVGRTIGFPSVPIERWLDTAALAAAMALPRALDHAAAALGLTDKDKVGRGIMLKLSRPARDGSRHEYWENVEDFEKLFKYCGTDVEVERELFYALPPLSEQERAIWRFDYQVNARGVRVDVPAVEKIIELAGEYERARTREFSMLTGLNHGQTDRVTQWVEQVSGLQLSDYRRETLKKVLDSAASLSPIVRRAIELRLSLGRISTRKFPAMLSALTDGDRLRGMFMYHGASTGRWTAKHVQLHNLPKGKLEDPDAVMDMILAASEVADVEAIGDPMEVFSGVVRSALIPADGHKFVVADFSSIEARTLGWVADEPGYLDAFRAGRDLYVDLASVVFGVKPENVTKEQRHLGKTSILGQGYQMGKKKFVETARKGGVSASEDVLLKAFDTYRSTYTNITSLWKRVEKNAIAAVRHPGKAFGIPGRYRFSMGHIGLKPNRVPVLYLTLASGRKLAYIGPTIESEMMDWGPVSKLCHMGVHSKTHQWTKLTTYGGKLTENLIQATARDLLAHGALNANAHGYPVVLHVHDEAVAEVPKDFGSVEEFEELMCDAPEWALDLPFSAEGAEMQRYKK